mmetsp:Transcript_86619/g.244096  ORF Transcript_86619/g.244096 Transcript_86619/m.244096 type:complete len:320 (+) Transcript_86619:20-979(+)
MVTATVAASPTHRPTLRGVGGGSVLCVLRFCTPRAGLERLQPQVPVVSVGRRLAARALHPTPLEHREARDHARIVLGAALRARHVGRVDVCPALVARPRIHLLLHALVHGPTQHPISDFLDLRGGDAGLLGQVQVVGRGDVRVHEVRVVDGRIVGVLDGIRDVQESVQEEERHVDHIRILAFQTSVVETTVHGELGAIPAQCNTGLRDQLRTLLLFLEAVPHRLQVRRHKGLGELGSLRAAILEQSLRRRRRAAYVARRDPQQAEQHIPANLRSLRVNIAAARQQLARDNLVELEVRLLHRRPIPNQRLASRKYLSLVG